ncbi:glycoside hydrolase 5 family protein [Nonomuraea sediminis]|uniref:glycoside hydrolase 5 family protein n=1 Tax=Nonomuraea sediminis TaxID=2835864 RepID=UPI001BDC08FF|nr:cellulase family glycosylhydrolase [Nonomuraea sediminis]
MRYLQIDGRPIIPVGTHVVPPEGPDWPWRTSAKAFDEAFARMAALGLNIARIDLIWAAVEPSPGSYDEEHAKVLDEILESAGRHGVYLHPTLFVGGEVGDAFWDVPWREGRNPHADADLRAAQEAHARRFAERWAGHPAIIAWDLTDEPPFWAVEGTTDDDARAWTSGLVEALRPAGHPITVGTASQEVDHGPFRADVVAPLLDFACVHPYPIYSPELYPDGLLDPRMTHAAAFEVALAEGAGRPVMLHEFGASSTQFDPARIAAYDRLLCWSALGRGAIGFVSWCWSDCEPAAYRRVPYSRMPHETQFGMVTAGGELRPRGQVLADLAATLQDLDLVRHAAHGPSPRAAIMVPHEYVHPYDPASYGLEAPHGPYVPAELTWRPDPSVKPLVRAWLNAFVLAAGAGMAVSFPRERLDEVWPSERLVMLPAPLASTTTSLWHVRASFWDGAPAYLAGGGTIYASLSADVAIPDLDRLTGCAIADRAPAADTVTLRFVEPWGPLEPGAVLTLPAADDDPTLRGVRLAVTDPSARVVAVDADGEPALVVSPGQEAGRVVLCAYPVELLLARVPDAHRRHAGWKALYQGLADLADAREEAWAEGVTGGALHGPEGGVLALTNHSPDPVEATLHLPGAAKAVHLLEPHGRRPIGEARVRVAGHGAALVVWDT